MSFLGGSVVKNPPANAEDVGSIPESGRSPGRGNGNPLQYSCLENPMDRWAWQATVHWVTKSWTQLKQLSISSTTYAYKSTTNRQSSITFKLLPKILYKWIVFVQLLSCVWLCATPWTIGHQAHLSMGFSRQEYWSGLPFPSPLVTLKLNLICFHF